MKNDFNLNNMLCFQLAKAHQLFNRFYKDPLSKFHLTYVQYVTLVALWNHNHVTVNQLSAAIGLNNGTLTPLLKRMQRNGWIQRKKDPRDKRRVIVSLTRTGADQQNQVVSSTDRCMVNLNYKNDEYRKVMATVKDIQKRLRYAIRVDHKRVIKNQKGDHND